MTGREGEDSAVDQSPGASHTVAGGSVGTGPIPGQMICSYTTLIEEHNAKDTIEPH